MSDTTPTIQTSPQEDLEIQEHLQAMKEITGAQSEINASIQGAKDMHIEACADRKSVV